MSRKKEQQKGKVPFYAKGKPRKKRESFKISREELAKQTEEFLKNGGKIEQIESNVIPVHDWGDLERWLNIMDDTGQFLEGYARI